MTQFLTHLAKALNANIYTKKRIPNSKQVAPCFWNLGFDFWCL